MRKHKYALTVLFTLVAVGGCQTDGPPTPKAPLVRDHRSKANEAMIRTLNDRAARNAALSEHTVYPYHFDKYSAQLNSLGRHHLKVLAEGLRNGLDTLHLPRGEADDALYQQRRNTLRQRLAALDLDAQAVTLRDAMPAGEGTESQQALRALQKQRQASERSDYDTNGMDSGTTTEGVIQ
jgi:hypothetical protein